MITENYTMTLYEIINNFYTRAEVEEWFKQYELSDYLNDEQIQTILDNGVWSKDKLAQKIVDHYLFEQIGFETMALFKHKVKITMKEIMESKLPLIYSRAIEYDPLVNVDYTEEFTRNIQNEGTSSSESSSDSSGLNVGSDTPQGQISKQQILQGTYATGTNASETEASVNDSTEASNTTDEEYTKRVRGNSGVSATAQKMIEQFRDNIRAIDYEIIKELEDLFMIIY